MGNSQNGYVKRPQVFDGEGVDPTDFNALSNFSRAYLNDLVFGSMMKRSRGIVGPEASAATIFAVNHSGAPRNRASALQYGCNAGPIFYCPSGPTVDGQTPKVLAYWLTQNEITGTFAAADATNPRWDAIYVRVSSVNGANATRDFQDATGAVTSQALAATTDSYLEWTVVQGTPAAIPALGAAPDATWALWGMWYIPATFATAFSIVNIFDWRVPVGTRRDFIPPCNLQGSSWTLEATFGLERTSTASTGVNSPLLSWCPSRHGRLMGVNFVFSAAPGPDAGSFILLSTASPGRSGEMFFPIMNGRPGSPYTGMSATEMNGYTLRNGVWYNSAFAARTTSPSGYVLPPLWANGTGSAAEGAALDATVAIEHNGTNTVADDTWIIIAQWCPNSIGERVEGAVWDFAGTV